ncbi:hypothetical protein PPGU19_093050 (plasmid) [Paraburkholderia sp. PGU19]|uniref:hypothetical protein n=1 Tax=Paraburkholderia sp. PGU19 TaxID=2735434 RepID=UPI0015DA797F|nr:hypothetical protein [Paraburkholderia sp. PGU19]BCG04737.1 hypothetical protein PPGU19_093050 [Paraburkholderia sp. PGU19]
MTDDGSDLPENPAIAALRRNAERYRMLMAKWDEHKGRLAQFKEEHAPEVTDLWAFAESNLEPDVSESAEIRALRKDSERYQMLMMIRPGDWSSLIDRTPKEVQSILDGMIAIERPVDYRYPSD